VITVASYIRSFILLNSLMENTSKYVVAFEGDSFFCPQKKQTYF